MTDERKESGLVERFAGHTPGPWVFQIRENGVHEVAAMGDRHVALLPDRGCLRADVSAREVDGRLIAAAPEILVALIARDTEIERLREALEPSGDTKAAYMGEFSFTIMQAQEDENGEAIECPTKVYVPWTTIKEIMAAILARATRQETDNAD